MKNHFEFYAKITLSIIATILVSAMLLKAHFILAIAVAGFATFPIWGAVQRFRELVELERWARRIENVHIISNHPRTGERLYIADEDLRAVCVFVEHSIVHKTALDIQEKLKQSKNKRYIGKGLKDNQRLKVHEHIYRHGIHCNEDWATEFAPRVIEFIKEDRKAQHRSLSSTEDSEWYLRHLDYQI